MSSPIILNEKTQQRLQYFAVSHGLNSPEEAVVALLNESPTASLSSQTKQEEEILRRITAGLPETFWQRKKALDARAEQLTLTEEDHQERTSLVQKLEQWQVSLLEDIVALAQVKKEAPTVIMRRLGKPKPMPTA
jgi:phosphoglycerate-specific signal transduction histidine kinase